MTIVDITDVQLKGLKIFTTHRRDFVIYGKYVTQLLYFK